MDKEIRVTLEMENSARKEKYKRNESLELALKDINSILYKAECKEIDRFSRAKYPIILILGNPRSGSTLLLQWLASLGCFGFPTNMISRFYGAPYLGAKIQKVLAEYDFKGEIFDPEYIEPFCSDLGKTKGPLAPHEFWYFWRRFFKYNEIQKLEPEKLKEIDVDLLLSELSALEHEFKKPLAFKGMMFNWNVDFLDSLFEKTLFIHLRRNPIHNIDDILYARLHFFDDLERWYSFKPPEYEKLKSSSPLIQVAGQIFYTDQYIAQQFEKISEDRTLTVDYEELCSNPSLIYSRIYDKFAAQGYHLPQKYSGVSQFRIDDELKIISQQDAESVYNQLRGVNHDGCRKRENL